MDELDGIITEEFSGAVIGVLNHKLDVITDLVSGHMDEEEYARILDELSITLVDISKEYFTQGFLRGIAAAKGGAI